MRARHPIDGTDNHGTCQGPKRGFIDGLERPWRGPKCLAKEHIIANALFDGSLFASARNRAARITADGDEALMGIIEQSVFSALTDRQ